MTATKEPRRATIGTRGYTIWMLVLLAALVVAQARNIDGISTALVVWAIGMTIMWRRGEKERRTLAEGDRLLAESRATDHARQDQRRDLLTRLAADMQQVAERRSA